MIKWVDVRSSAIRKIGYDAIKARMYIDFKDSDPYYTFCNVPDDVFQSFISARSVGQYYHLYVKGKYDC